LSAEKAGMARLVIAAVQQPQRTKARTNDIRGGPPGIKLGTKNSRMI
jgi:hypothetical protein